MSSEWVPFTDLLSTIVDNRGRTCPVGDSGVPLIATNCIDPNSLYPRYDTTRFVSDNTYRTWFRGHPMPGDILFVCKGSPGRTNWVPDPVDFCIAQDMVSVRADERRIYPKYLFAALRSSVVQAQIDNMHVGTMIPHFKKGDFGKLNIPVPSRDEQQVIGDFYFSLSERVALLRETNTTLEAIAQALFKSWFVDFDPVRAKMEGRAPEGMDEATAALFPDSFEESELGLVPKGWRVGTLADVASYQNGYAFKTKDWSGVGHPVIKIGNVKPGIIETTGASYVLPETIVGLDRFRLQRGDLLVGMTGYVGETGLVPEIEPAAYLNQRVGKISTESGISDLGFVYCIVRNPAYKTHAESKSHGSAQANVSGTDLMSYPTVLPSTVVLDVFNQILAVFIWQILVNYEESQSLAALRDTLLPRLISGQLDLTPNG